MGKKHYDVADDIKRLLLSDLREQKQKQTASRIAAWVFNSPSQERFERIITVTTTTCTISSQQQLSPTWNVVDARASIIGRALAHVLLTEPHWLLFLTLKATEHREAKALEEHPPKRRWVRITVNGVRMQVQPPTPAEIRRKGMGWLLSTFYEYVGGTLERSMQFALFLLEVFAQESQENIDGAPIPASILASKTLMVTSIIYGSAIAVPKKNGVQKHWLNQLIAHLEEKSEVEEVLASVLSVLLTAREDNLLRYRVIPDEGIEVAELPPTNQPLIESLQNPTLCLSKSQYATIERWEKRDREARAQRARRTVEYLQWAEEHRARLAALCEQKRQKITAHPRRGLRPSGIDHVDLTATLLYEIGLRSVAFYPEGRTFPNTRLHFVVRKETPHLLIYPTELRALHIPEGTLALRNARFQDLSFLHSLVEYAVIDILWRIVCGKRTLRPKRHERNDDRGDAAPSSNGEAKPIRPHFRQLPNGWHASTEAMERGMAAFGWLPAGCTFVKGGMFVPAQYRNGRLTHNLPTEPFAIYGDDDFMDLTDPT